MKNYKEIAEEKMAKQNHMHALVQFVYGAIASTASFVTYGIGGLIIAGPMEFGYSKYIIEVSEGKIGKIETLFVGFNNFTKTLILGLLKAVYLGLWFMLLIIPGIIKAFAYSMSFFVMIDNPGFDANAAITKSREIMNGHKMELFLIYLSFILKILLAIVTLGIYSFWLTPTMQLAKYEFYLDLTGKNVKKTDAVEGTVI